MLLKAQHDSPSFLAQHYRFFRAGSFSSILFHRPMGVPFRLLAAPAMPPPSASDETTHLAGYWIADAIAGDDSLGFSVLSALVDARPEILEGAPEATRERVARRCLQQLSSMIAAGGDAAANAVRVTRVDGARSCQELLFQITS